MYQIITSYTLNSYNVVCQFYLNKARNKKFIPKVFLLMLLQMGLVFLISLPDSLLVYKNATYFELILHLATLLNSLMRSNVFLLGYLVFGMYKILSLANKRQFYFFFSYLDAFCFLA